MGIFTKRILALAFLTTTLMPRSKDRPSQFLEEIPTDLYVVFNIAVYKAAGDFRAEGGETLLIEGWHPEHEDLTPTQYVYTLPKSE